MNIQLDSMLKRKEAAAWLRMSEEELRRKSGPDAQVPVFRLGQRSDRYHPRTILAKMAADSGVGLQIVAASYGISMKGQVAP